MSRNQQLLRFAELVRRYIVHEELLDNPKELAKEFNVSLRTIYRDLEVLERLLNEFKAKKQKNAPASTKAPVLPFAPAKAYHEGEEDS